MELLDVGSELDVVVVLTVETLDVVSAEVAIVITVELLDFGSVVVALTVETRDVGSAVGVLLDGASAANVVAVIAVETLDIVSAAGVLLVVLLDDDFAEESLAIVELLMAVGDSVVSIDWLIVYMLVGRTVDALVIDSLVRLTVELLAVASK